MKTTAPASIAAAGVVALTVVLSGCAGTTYGTGVSPGRQTVKDISGLVTLKGDDGEPIEYTPRPAIVTPPSANALPKPGEGTGVANWPNDPDQAKKQQSAAAVNTRGLPTDEERDAEILSDPGFRLPKSNEPNVKMGVDDPYNAAAEIRQMQEVKEEQKKVFATAKSSRAGAVDANGNPVRTTLTEPPAEYRVPDPTAPDEFTAAKDEKWWQVFRRNGRSSKSTPTPTEATVPADAAAPTDGAAGDG
ncbi:MAG: hypothetical protein GY798_35305 [Hyphomicrobiales bacterium]|nr:hypothetical protein [Hyphomicrobiales bacterium]